MYYNEMQNEGNDYENKRMIFKYKLNMKQESFSIVTVGAE